MRKKVKFIVMVLILSMLVVAGQKLGEQVSSDRVQNEKTVIIVDCGHGANDPGKVGAGNLLEKDVNLQIGKKVEKELKKKGYEIVMTRTDDKTLAKGGSDNKKVQDMRERVALINRTEPQLAISIHQNSFSDPSVHGSQVFYYSHSPEGEMAAKVMQEALLSVDKENKRQAKANDTYYLLKRTEVPTIIVECGFLSNPEEAALLKKEEYQKKIASAIAKGAEKYLESK